MCNYNVYFKDMPGNKIYVQGSYIDVHDNENVYLSVDKAEVKTQTTGSVQKTEKEHAKVEDEPKEELFKFIHPAITDDEELKIHQQVKKLVSRQNIQMICSYLKDMAKEKKILLPPNPSSMYAELVRLGMPTGEGFGEKNFTKYYK